MIELSKSQKKIARELIQMGLQRECTAFLEGIRRRWGKPEDGKTPHESYLDLYREVYRFDKHIARRYDGMSGSRYLITVYALYADSVLTEQDIEKFDENIRTWLIETKSKLNEDRWKERGRRRMELSSRRYG